MIQHCPVLSFPSAMGKKMEMSGAINKTSQGEASEKDTMLKPLRERLSRN